MPDYVAAYDDITTQLQQTSDELSDILATAKDARQKADAVQARVQQLQDIQKALAALPEVAGVLTKRDAALDVAILL